MNKYLQERVTALGLEIIDSPTLTKLLEKLSEMEDEQDDPTGSPGYGDCVIAYGDSDVFEQVVDVLGMCLKHPGRKTWIVADFEASGNTLTAIFAEDSVRAATKRLRASIEAWTELLRTSRGAARTGDRR